MFVKKIFPAGRVFWRVWRERAHLCAFMIASDKAAQNVPASIHPIMCEATEQYINRVEQRGPAAPGHP
jgi:hypothetical protein